MRQTLAHLTLLLLAILSVARPTFAENWPCWRGPRGDGSSSDSEIPTRWNGTNGDNILWKTALPGTGHSSPIVWNERVFVGACDEKTGDRILISIERRTGNILWQKTVVRAPLEKKHKLNSFASGTPATDGQMVYVAFLKPDASSLNERTPGEMIVSAYDFAGQQQWQVSVGRFASVHGYCSSPVLFKDSVIVNGDHDGDGYIVALQRDHGEVQWRIPRENNTRSYVTPIIREFNGRTQMILSGSKCVASYDPHNGARHWYLPGPTEQFVASMVDNGSLVFLTAGFPEHHILAIRPDGKGTLDDSHIVWRTTKGCSYVPSPIVVGDYFLVAADNGIGSCYEADNGKLMWLERMAPHFSASLVAANGLVYFVADDGVTKIIRPGPKFEVVAENPLGEYCYASPAISNGRLFIRSEHHLFCVGKQ